MRSYAFWVAVLIGLAPTALVAEERTPNPEDLMRICEVAQDQDSCELAATEFSSDFRKAYKKDYQAQRNVAFCLYDGCDGAVVVNKPFSCAWRLVILASGSHKVDSTDRSNFDLLCRGKLSPSEVIVFRSQADELYRAIYKRALPSSF